MTPELPRKRVFRFSPPLVWTPPLAWGDGLVLVGLAALLYAGARLALHAPEVISGPEISLAPAALPWYALLSTARMAAAYVLSLLFSLGYGYAAARNPAARRVLIPLLDVLQSVPILAFLPVVLLSLSAVLPQGLAAELSAIVLIVTSQVWNMTFSFYQSMTTLPEELRQAATIFRFDPWLRFTTLELPFAAVGLIWNSMMSWAGGWFFLMAAEIFTVGSRDFRLPGLGAYLQVAANRGDLRAVLFGVGTLVLTIVALDQFVWRPILAWADRFRLDMVAGEEPPGSWFGDSLSRSFIFERLEARIWNPLAERFSAWMRSRRGFHGDDSSEGGAEARFSPRLAVCLAIGLLLVLYGGYRALGLLLTLPGRAWAAIGLGVLATALRVAAALAVALLWTIPLGVVIGTNRRLATVLQPVVQVIASIPATALFPVFVLALLHLPGGLNIAAVLMMLMGTQWYLLFNVIAGASTIPQDLRYTTEMLRLTRVDHWRTLILPALLPYIVTGAITASGGAWNASIVAERIDFGGRAHETIGVGALIAQATGRGDYALLLAGTLALIMTVVGINRSFWRRLYRLAEERYRMD